MTTSAPRYWYDSWPGVEVETEHPVLDRFGTPFGGPEGYQTNQPNINAWDEMDDWHAPYTTVSQNRGGNQ